MSARSAANKALGFAGVLINRAKKRDLKASNPFTDLASGRTRSRLKVAADARADERRNARADAFKAEQSGEVSKTFGSARGRLQGQGERARERSLEDSNRLAAIRGTSGAGFENKLRSLAQEQVDTGVREGQQQLTEAESQAKQGVSQFAEQIRSQDIGTEEARRQFEKSFGLQDFIARNELDLSKFSTTINAFNALKESGIDGQNIKELFNINIFRDLFKGLGVTNPSPRQPTFSGDTVTIPGDG